MSEEELEIEDKEMREWFRSIKTGSRLIKLFFSFCMAVGAAYLMAKSIISSR